MATESAALPRKVLFVCIGNTCRSQMAEAVARHFHAATIQPSSAGISPFGRIVDDTRRILHERGVELGAQYCKGLSEAPVAGADLIVNMTGMPGRSLFPGRKVLDWDVADPYAGGPAAFREVLEDIEERIAGLARTLRAGEEPHVQGRLGK
jgi:protein-tyrosine-phosphatase